MKIRNIISHNTAGVVGFFLLPGLLLMSGPLQAETSQKDNTPLHQAAAEWIQHFKAGDLESLMSLYTEDVTVALHGQPVLHGIDAVRSYFSARIGGWNSEFELSFERVEMGQEQSWLLSKYWFIAEDKKLKTRFRDAGRSLLIYELSDDGRWLIAADIDQASPDVYFPSPSGLE